MFYILNPYKLSVSVSILHRVSAHDELKRLEKNVRVNVTTPTVTSADEGKRGHAVLQPARPIRSGIIDIDHVVAGHHHHLHHHHVQPTQAQPPPLPLTLPSHQQLHHAAAAAAAAAAASRGGLTVPDFRVESTGVSGSPATIMLDPTVIGGRVSSASVAAGGGHQSSHMVVFQPRAVYPMVPFPPTTLWHHSQSHFPPGNFPFLEVSITNYNIF